MPAWLVRLWPALAGVVAAIAIGLWVGSLTDAAYDRGVADERAKWEADEKERQLAFRERADTASAKAAERQAARENAARASIERTRVYYVDRPAEAAAVCLIADRVRDIETTDAAITAATSTSPDPLPDPSAAEAK